VARLIERKSLLKSPKAKSSKLPGGDEECLRRDGDMKKSWRSSINIHKGPHKTGNTTTREAWRHSENPSEQKKRRQAVRKK